MDAVLIRRRAGAVASVLVLTAPAAPDPAGAAEAGRLSLSPSRAEGVASPGLRAGPFALRNGTELTFETSLRPVLLGQNRDGGIFVRSDAAARRRAAQLLEVRAATAPLPPGATVSAGAVLRRPGRDGGFYGGILFRSEPLRGGEGSGLRQAFELNAALFLRPPSTRRRYVLRAGAIRAEQAAPRDLRLLVPFADRGNVDVTASGAITVRREGERQVALRARLPRIRVLPGHEVDLAVRPAGELPAGRYVATASVRAAGRRLRARGRFTLFGPDAVAARDGALERVTPGDAEIGRPADIDVGWRNSGNVAFAPRAEVVVRELDRGGTGRPLQRVTVELPEVAAGAAGGKRLEIAALAKGTYEVSVRLLDGDRELDARTVGVTPVPVRSLLERLEEWARANVVLIGLAFPVLLLLVVVGFARRERRLRARLAASG